MTYAVALMAAGDSDEAREHMARATAAVGDDRWADLLTRAGDVGGTGVSCGKKPTASAFPRPARPCVGIVADSA